MSLQNLRVVELNPASKLDLLLEKKYTPPPGCDSSDGVSFLIGSDLSRLKYIEFAANNRAQESAFCMAINTGIGLAFPVRST